MNTSPKLLRLKLPDLTDSAYINGTTMRVNVNAIYALLIASVLLIVVNAIITYDNIREKEYATDRIIHSYRIIQSSTQLLTLFMDMESGQRGYILTGDKHFLNTYKMADEMLRQEIDLLSVLLKGQIEETKQDHKIIFISQAKRKDMARTLDVLNQFGTDSATLHMDMGAMQQRMDSLRAQVRRIVRDEEVHLEEQTILLASNRKLDPLRFSAFGLIGITCLLAFGTIIRKEKASARLLKKLRDTNRQLENKVQERTRQLVAASQAKDHFLGIATHDLKAPINGVLGFIELMKREERMRNPQDIEYLAHMERSCRKMQALITDLLDINRIDQGLARINKEPVELEAFLDKLEAEYSMQAEKKGIILEVNKVQSTLYTDPDALSRVLENLLSNAIKFSPGQRTVYLVTTHASDIVEFEVKDQGPGIAPEELPRLFGKFQRLANRPTSKENSTGLGLSIVKELTALLGGSISVTSEVGIGTVFTVKIPATETQE
ncbi:MAG TPA: ATP-binding protein [Ohtaekwangia sp.]|uniref:sensor histidine kinase n=1 Tax=Ohtaekwangia sp. TaxID=2066019 RepID=UPI002F94F7CE